MSDWILNKGTGIMTQTYDSQKYCSHVGEDGRVRTRCLKASSLSNSNKIIKADQRQIEHHKNSFR